MQQTQTESWNKVLLAPAGCRWKDLSLLLESVAVDALFEVNVGAVRRDEES
jgi:hypothetical protein